MRTRTFWRKRSILTEMLVPFSVLWFCWMRLRAARAKPLKLSVPVICVGNVTAGGAGKTPVALAIAEMLKARGQKPAFISRGYGGTFKDILKVKEHHSAEQVGDEPLLLARIAPCYICRDRVKAAELAIADGANILIADDGLQNHGFVKDLAIVVVDGGYGIGNGLVIPAGPLRDRIDFALQPAHAIVMIGRASPDVLAIFGKANLPRHTAELQPLALPAQSEPYLAFAGIGIPQKFFDTLRKIGVNVVRAIPYPDHHPYRTKDIRYLRDGAEKLGAKLITTEKDAVRLPQGFRAEVQVLPVKLVFDDEEAFAALLEKHLP